MKRASGLWKWGEWLQTLFSDRHLLTERVAGRRRPLSVFIRYVDGGSSNDGELEIAALLGSVYNLEGYGIELVSSPARADVLLITGPVTRNMEAALVAAFRAMPQPRRVVTAGDGFRPDGPFAGSYATVPMPEELVAAWVVHIPGDPPAPRAILEVFLKL